MNIYIISIFLLISSISFRSVLQTKSITTQHIFLEQQEKSYKIGLDFPVEPEISAETIPIYDQSLELTIKYAITEEEVNLLFEIKLEELIDQINEDQSGFFTEVISYLLSDLGGEYGNLTDYEYKGFKGVNFDMLNFSTKENSTAKGKTLLVNDKAFIWFGVSNAEDSSERVNSFINSFNLK